MVSKKLPFQMYMLFIHKLHTTLDFHALKSLHMLRQFVANQNRFMQQNVLWVHLTMGLKPIQDNQTLTLLSMKIFRDK